MTFIGDQGKIGRVFVQTREESLVSKSLLVYWLPLPTVRFAYKKPTAVKLLSTIHLSEHSWYFGLICLLCTTSILHSYIKYHRKPAQNTDRMPTKLPSTSHPLSSLTSFKVKHALCKVKTQKNLCLNLPFSQVNIDT